MVDGGVVFGQLAKSEWEQLIKPDRRNRVRLGLNALLFQTPGLNMLIDTGAGGKRMIEMKEDYSLNGNKLIKGLKALGLTARDIHLVVLTNLHFDHSGGCTKLDRTGTAIPMFPKAKYIVQRSSWEAAQSPNERFVDYFHEDDFEPLAERDLICFVEDEEEIIPGVRVKQMAGPAQGNQVVFIEYGSERLVYAGDLIPTPFHLPLHHIPATAEFPNDTLVQKRELLETAMADGWLIVFGHGHECSSGYLRDRGGVPQLVPVEI
jgi:glyoxylase-like metal-dependent hydrolase (beta-lactamase superfamily II)